MPPNEPESVTSSPRGSRLRTWLREPLLQVFVIGLGIFAADRALNPTPAAQQEEVNRIVITSDDLAQIQVAWMAQWRRAPTPEELRSLVDGKIREEILAREATALGLDKDDTIIKRRLAQKMEFLLEDVSALKEPSSEELRHWFDQNAQRFALPSLVTFHHLYFSTDRLGQRARDEAAAALEKLDAKQAELPEGVGDPFMFHDFYAERSADQVAGIFGSNFAEALFQLKPGSWHGPIESGLGWHLVFVGTITPGGVPAFEEAEDTIRSGWLDEQRAQSKRKMFESVAARYQIVLPQTPLAGAAGTVAHANSLGQ